MEHLLIIVEILSLLLGGCAITLTFFAMLRFPSRFLKGLILFQSLMGIIIFDQVLSAYIGVNGLKEGWFSQGIRYLSWLSTLGLVYVIPMLGYLRYDEANWQKRRILYKSLIFGGVLLIPIYLVTKNQWVILFANSPLFFVLIETIYRVAKHHDHITNPIEEKVVNRLGILAIIFVPLIFLDTKTEAIEFLNRWFPYGLLSTPLFFTGLNMVMMLGMWEYMKSEFHFLENAPKMMDQSLPMIWSSYGLTQREQEVAEGLIKGLTYPEIGTLLTISLSTVKTHVKNIYQKAEVTSKVELIHKVAESKRR